mmetsp:Transcript_77003/g.221175  ORF Transcript_77003/g.221175 Transcript_77003/m.221175 type:complete len:209 (+) Transcript_77003:853-1479(+)
MAWSKSALCSSLAMVSKSRYSKLFNRSVSSTSPSLMSTFVSAFELENRSAATSSKNTRAAAVCWAKLTEIRPVTSFPSIDFALTTDEVETSFFPSTSSNTAVSSSSSSLSSTTPASLANSRKRAFSLASALTFFASPPTESSSFRLEPAQEPSPPLLRMRAVLTARALTRPRKCFIARLFIPYRRIKISRAISSSVTSLEMFFDSRSP